MNGNVTNYSFVLYERLASQKLNEILSSLNSHNHGSGGGLKIDVANAIDSGTITNAHLGTDSVDGRVLENNSVTTDHIVNGTITYGDLNSSSIHLSSDGYAVYAP